jgi:hypothetical protein
MSPVAGRSNPGVAQRGMGEAIAVWQLFGITAAAVLLTYTRVPAERLYHVTGSGAEAGLSRALVFLNWPTAGAAAGLAALAAAALRSRAATATATLAVALCSVAVWPGVVDQALLDAKPVNAVPAVGVGLALALTVVAAVRVGPRWAPRQRYDAARVAIAACISLPALPWLAAELGFSFGGIPVLGTLFQTGELRTQPGNPIPHPAVHLGDHHGLQGVLFVLTALALSRPARQPVMRAYVALLFGYGLVNAAQDFWLEQIVKRGWTDFELPAVLRPAASWGWLVVAMVAVAAFCVLSPRRSTVLPQPQP